MKRQDLTKAALEIMPDLRSLVPKNISEIDLWNLAMERSFLEDLKSEAVIILRTSLLQFKKDGFIQ